MNPNLNLTTSNRFKLILTGEMFRESAFELSVTGVTMPGVSSGVMEPYSPLRPIPMPGGTLTFDDLYCTFIVTEEYTEWLEMFDWIIAINYGDEINARRLFATAELVVLSNKFNPLFSFTFERAFPYLLGTVDLTQDMMSNETLTSNVSFKFVNMKVNRRM